MDRDLLTIFRKNIFKDSDNISSIVRDGKNPEVFLDLERDSVRFEPFEACARRESPHRLLYEFPSSSIFGSKDFPIFDTRRHIASSSSGNDDFFPWTHVLLKEMDMEIRNSCMKT